MSVFAASKEDPSLSDQATRLNEKLQDECKGDDSLGIAASLVKVPMENIRYVGFLNRMLGEGQYFFQIYDNKLGHPVRRFTHQNNADTAFCISANAQWLVRAEGKDLEFKVAVLPDDKDVNKVLKMQYKSSTQDNYGNACDKKQTFKDRIYRDLHVYHMYEEEAKEDIVQKMSNGVTRE